MPLPNCFELLDLGLTDAHIDGMSSTLVCYVKHADEVVVHLAGTLTGTLTFEREGWDSGVFFKALVSVSDEVDEIAVDLTSAIEDWHTAQFEPEPELV